MIRRTHRNNKQMLLVSFFIIAICFSEIRANENSKPIKIICLGNSITNGVPVYPPYPLELGVLLDNKYGKDVCVVENYGVGGTTLSKVGNNPYWNQEVFKNAKESAPDIVIIKFGTNDSKPANWPKAEPTYADDIREIISIFQNLPTAPKVYLGIPTWVAKDVYNIRGEVLEKDVTPIIRKTAVELDIDTIDFYSPLKGHPELYMDGVHLTKSGAIVLAQAAADAITKDINPGSNIKQNEINNCMIYPSVASPGEKITIQSGNNGEILVNIYNLYGMNIKSTYICGSPVQIDVPDNTGMYIVKISDNIDSKDFKLLVK